MEIQIDREKKIILLRWLKRGVIDSGELDKLNGLKDLTDEEIEAELDRLAAICHDEQCERLKRLGYCIKTKTKRNYEDSDRPRKETDIVEVAQTGLH